MESFLVWMGIVIGVLFVLAFLSAMLYGAYQVHKFFLAKPPDLADTQTVAEDLDALVGHGPEILRDGVASSSSSDLIVLDEIPSKPPWPRQDSLN